MASIMLNGVENLALLSNRNPNRLGFFGSDLCGKNLPRVGFISYARVPNRTMTLKCNLSTSKSSSQPRFIQHKKVAFWFYRFLSIGHDHIINPEHWIEDIRDDALEQADLSDRNMIIVDVGGGMVFTTLGVVKHVETN
ncbi:hypothetical protein K1719_041031 [Acacia pycnantha]|nr:hypothetical protein K1719_041031 [Acacia pycnantha]